jgi:hypothetical protein
MAKAGMGIVAGVAEGMAGEVTQLATGVLGTFLAAASRDVNYTANRLYPNLIPDVGTIARLWHGDILGTPYAQWLLNSYGIDVQLGKVGDTNRQQAWSAAIGGMRPWLSLDLYRRWFRQGKISETSLNQIMNMHGFSLDAVFTGTNTNELATWYADSEPLHWEFLLDLLRRELITPEEFAIRLAALGVADPADQRRLFVLRHEIPTIADHLHWLTRNVDDPQYTADFLLWAGFADRATVAQLYTEINAAAGDGGLSGADLAAVLNVIQNVPLPDYLQKRNFYATFKRDLDSQGMRPRDALFHYLAHWKNPAPGEAATMRFRLRPEKVAAIVAREFGAPWDPANPGMVARYQALVFDDTRYRRTLAEQDVGPSFVDRYLLASYHPLPIRYVRQLYDTGVWTDADARSILLDLGHDPAQVDSAVQALEIQKARTVAQQAHGYTVNLAQEMYADGCLSDGDYVQMVQNMGWPAAIATGSLTVLKSRLTCRAVKENIAAVKKTYLAGGVDDVGAGDALAQLNVNPFVKPLLLQTWKNDAAAMALTHRHQEAEKLRAARVKTIGAGFEHGHITPQLATLLLTQAGLDDDHANDYVALWQFERAMKATPPTAAELLRAAKAGRIGLDQLGTLLLAADNTPERVSLYVAEAAAALIAAQTKQAEMSQAQQQKLAKALEQQLRQQQAMQRRIAMARFDLEKALKEADLKVQLAGMSNRMDKAQAEANLMRVLAEAKFEAEGGQARP